MAVQYLRCNVSKGPLLCFLDERVITFKSNYNPDASIIVAEKEWPKKDEAYCIVNEKDVEQYDAEGYNGLMKLEGFQLNEEEKFALVGIRQSEGGFISRFRVPLEEIVVK